jgi:hypothetical protein
MKGISPMPFVLKWLLRHTKRFGCATAVISHEKACRRQIRCDNALGNVVATPFTYPLCMVYTMWYLRVKKSGGGCSEGTAQY